MNHKGERLQRAILHIQTEFGTSKKAIAEKMRVSADMIYKYFKMNEFSDKILFRLAPLEDHFGINSKFFQDDNAEMLLEGKVQDGHLAAENINLKNTLYLQQGLIQSLKEQNEVLKENSLLYQQLLNKAGRKS